MTSVLFLVRFNNFAPTVGFYWSYMLLLKSPVLMHFWYNLISFYEQQMSLKCTNLLPGHAADIQDPNVSCHLCLNWDLSHYHYDLLLSFCNVRVGVHQTGSGMQASGTGPKLVERTGTKWTLPSLNMQMWTRKSKCVGQFMNYVKWPSGLAVQCIYITRYSYY